jgi:hypothetical protein
VTLSAAAVAAGAPPGVAISPATAAALFGAGGPFAPSTDVAAASTLRGIDVQIVQWGASPFNETAGIGALRYSQALVASATTPSASASPSPSAPPPAAAEGVSGSALLAA